MSLNEHRDNEELIKRLTENYRTAQVVIDDQARQLFDRTREYNNSVVTIGYASFFAIWAFTKDKMPNEVSYHIAFYMGISILLFILFVVIDMLFQTYVVVSFFSKMRLNTDFKSLDQIIEHSEQHAASAADYQKGLKRAGLGIVIVWPFFFLPSLFLGFYASLVMLYNFFALELGGLPTWPLPN